MSNNDRIYLSEREKKVLLLLHDKGFEGLSSDCNVPLSSLERKGLVKGWWVSGHIAEDAAVTDFGKEYIMNNPSLENPVDYSELAVIEARKNNKIAKKALIIAILSLIFLAISAIGCARILAFIQK